MKISNREIYAPNMVAELVKNDLSDFHISDKVIDVVIDSYIKVKSRIIKDGNKIMEPGLCTTGLQIRRVPKTFSDKKFTVKLVSSIDEGLRQNIVKDIQTNENLQEVLGFNKES